jgi:hypothetical protein
VSTVLVLRSDALSIPLTVPRRAMFSLLCDHQYLYTNKNRVPCVRSQVIVPQVYVQVVRVYMLNLAIHVVRVKVCHSLVSLFLFNLTVIVTRALISPLSLSSIVI